MAWCIHPGQQTFNVTVHNAVFMEHIDSSGDLLAVKTYYMLLQSQSGDLLQGPFITIFHKDVHFLLRDQYQEREKA